MEKANFIVTEKIDLNKYLRQHLPFLSNYQIEQLFKSKDIKVNGCRKTKSCNLNINDEVEVYYTANKEPWYTILFNDDNVLLVNKKAGIEVVSEEERNLFDILKLDFPTLLPIHRIDRNTEGIVIFAKNHSAEQELLKAFKERSIIKKYLLKVKGRVKIDDIKHKMYLKKLPSSSKVLISEVKTSGYDEIVTYFNIVKYIDNDTILQAELVTGKTHQIRAHIAYFGYPIVGDGKYGVGDSKNMCLTASYMAFKFPKKSYLEYLNNEVFEIKPSWL